MSITECMTMTYDITGTTSPCSNSELCRVRMFPVPPWGSKMDAYHGSPITGRRCLLLKRSKFTRHYPVLIFSLLSWS
ncbi:unnamed protein product [Lota lota]